MQIKSDQNTMTEQEIYQAIKARFAEAVVKIHDPAAKPVQAAPIAPAAPSAKPAVPTGGTGIPAGGPAPTTAQAGLPVPPAAAAKPPAPQSAAVSAAVPPVRPKPLAVGPVVRGWIELKPEALRDVLAWLKTAEGIELNMPHSLAGVDYKAGDPLGVTYHFTSLRHKHWAALKISVPRDKPVAPSIADIYPAMNWHEREAFDLVGIVFDGHPDLRRILCAEDWEGHPLRKDYKFPDSYHGIPTGKDVRWNS